MLTWKQKGKALFSKKQKKINVFVTVGLLQELTLSVMESGWYVGVYCFPGARLYL